VNTKDYINYFPELDGKGEDEQFAILEKARYHAFVVQRLSAKSVMFLLASFAIGAIFPAVSFVLFGNNIIANALSIGIGIFIGLTVNKKLNSFILKQGLQSVLSGNGTYKTVAKNT